MAVTCTSAEISPNIPDNPSWQRIAIFGETYFNWEEGKTLVDIIDAVVIVVVAIVVVIIKELPVCDEETGSWDATVVTAAVAAAERIDAVADVVVAADSFVVTGSNVSAVAAVNVVSFSDAVDVNEKTPSFISRIHHRRSRSDARKEMMMMMMILTTTMVITVMADVLIVIVVFVVVVVFVIVVIDR